VSSVAHVLLEYAGSLRPCLPAPESRRFLASVPRRTTREQGVAPAPGAKSRAHVWAWAIALTGAVVAADQAAKQLVMSRIEPGDPVELVFGIQLSNVQNKGVAFGLLAGGEGLVLALTLTALAALVTYFAFNPTRPDLWLAVGLLSGGALGNLADRVRSGAVIDFIDIPLWPTFNLADVAIVAGVAALVLILSHPAPAAVEAPNPGAGEPPGS
jgi:signal peptidase II